MKRIVCLFIALLVCCSNLPNVCATNARLTRGSLCQIIADTIQTRRPIIDKEAIENPFEDLHEEDENYEAILWMNMMGYIGGYEDGTFKPEGSVTNAEVARMLTRMAFGDFSVPDDAVIDKRLEYHWARIYVWKAADSGLMPNIGYNNTESNACENDIDYNALKDYVIFDEISIVSGDKKIEFSNSLGKPMIKNGCVMAPVRPVVESLDLVAEWEQETKTMIIKNDEYSLELKLDSSVMNVNGHSVIIDAPSCVVSGTTYIPVSVIAETIGVPVYWYPQINTMILKNSKKVIVDEPKDEFDAEANIVNGNVVVTTDVSAINIKKNIHIAIYDIDNKMIDYMVVPSVYSNNTVNTVFKYFPDMFYAKVFIWKSMETMQPVVGALTLILN